MSLTFFVVVEEYIVDSSNRLAHSFCTQYIGKNKWNAENTYTRLVFSTAFFALKLSTVG